MLILHSGIVRFPVQPAGPTKLLYQRALIMHYQTEIFAGSTTSAADFVSLEQLPTSPNHLPDGVRFTSVPLFPWQGCQGGPRGARLGSYQAQLPARLEKAAAKRKLEFLAGRLCANQAASQICLSPPLIQTGSAGEPIWPCGITGSISHSSKLACAAIAQGAGTIHIGIDLEDIARTKDMANLTSLILTRSEETYLPSGLEDRNRYVLQVFCLKEALYKAIYPILQRFVGFQEVALRRNRSGRWSVTAPGLRQSLLHWQLSLDVAPFVGHFLAFCFARRTSPP